MPISFNSYPLIVRQRGLVVLLIAILTACAPQSTTSSLVPIPVIQSVQQPDSVASSFLDAWSRKDYAAMYVLTSTQNRSNTSDVVFSTVYQDVDTALQLDTIVYTIKETVLQGATAAVHYDVSFTSARFGTIEDEGRTLRLIQNPEGWRIAWSKMDIFDGLAGLAQVRVVSQRDPRANIYDRDGQLMVEQGGTVIALYLARQNVPNEADCLDLLAEILRRQRGDLEALFNQYVGETVFYVGEIDPDIEAVRGQELSDICGIFPENRRFDRETRRYVGQGIAAHAIGYIGQIPADQIEQWERRGYQQGDLVGRSGIEFAYDAQLAGQAEQLLQIVEPGGTVIRELAGTAGTAPQPVILTLDLDLQLATAQALADAYTYAEPNWGSLSPGGGAIVIDVNTGAVLAMASYPSFDPGIFNPDTPVPNVGTFIAAINADPREPLFNRVTQGQYAPGSVFKIVSTTAIADNPSILDAMLDADGLFSCGLEWDGSSFGDNLLRADWRKWDEMEPAGLVNPSQALTTSCNPFFYEVGARLYERDPNLLMDYARRLGLGQLTGLNDVMPEVRGNLPTPSSVSAAINSSVGQSDVQVTLVQMARLTAAIANGGTLYQPYIVQQVGGLDGSQPVFNASPQQVGSVGVSEEVLDIVRIGMCQVTVDERLGTAVGAFENTNYLACGKTGTAQTSRREPNAWFVAYVPADNPQIAVAVTAQFSREGSEVAAPIARRIIDAYLGEPNNNYPPWWQESYVPLTIPEGSTGG